jgi:hypothetical protein
MALSLFDVKAKNLCHEKIDMLLIYGKCGICNLFIEF